MGAFAAGSEEAGAEEAEAEHDRGEDAQSWHIGAGARRSSARCVLSGASACAGSATGSWSSLVVGER